MVVHERHVLRIRHAEEHLAALAPLLCAGITTYSPLHHWKVGPGQKVGVVGIGGLDHMGIKLAHAMGAQVVAFITSESKRDGSMALVSAPSSPQPSPQVFSLIMKRRSLAVSMIGGIPETQEMLDFCAKHGIVASYRHPSCR